MADVSDPAIAEGESHAQSLVIAAPDSARAHDYVGGKAMVRGCGSKEI